MHFATHQPHAASAMALFGTQAKGIDITSVSPGFANARRASRGLSGLGDWFTDGMNAVTNQMTSLIGAVTGSTAQAEAQRNALAIAQAQAARDIETTNAITRAVPWVAGAVGLVGLGLILMSKKS